MHHGNPLITWAHKLEKLGACVVCGMQPKRVFGSRGKELTASHLASASILRCHVKNVLINNIFV